MKDNLSNLCLKMDMFDSIELQQTTGCTKHPAEKQVMAIEFSNWRFIDNNIFDDEKDLELFINQVNTAIADVAKPYKKEIAKKIETIINKHLDK